MEEFGMHFFRDLVFKVPLPKKQREAFVFFKIVMVMIETESSGGVVVRALASHQCGLGSISNLGVIKLCGLSLLVLFSALRSLKSPLILNRARCYKVPCVA